MSPHRIVFTGPESSGKTTLAIELAHQLGIQVVPEFARTYLEAWKKPYTLKDLEYMVRGQIAWEKYFARTAEKVLLLDTDWTVFQVWLNHFEPNANLQIPETDWSMAFLCSPDFPWEYDPLREHPTERQALFEAYRALLTRTKRPFQILEGPHEVRLEKAIQIIRPLLD